MRVLFDHGTPVPLRLALINHTVSTAYDMGWADLDNGALLKAAETRFDALITTDQNLRYQQNLTGLRLAILVLPTTSWPKIQAHEERVAAAGHSRLFTDRLVGRHRGHTSTFPEFRKRGRVPCVVSP